MSTGPEPPPPLDRATADAALADLNALRELLQRAGRSEVGPAQMTGAMRDYWHDHGPLVRRAASAAGEQLRLQALSELYKWRNQLSAQLQARNAALDRSPQLPGAPADVQSDADHGGA